MPAVGDYRDMKCEVAREALSARLDGEREPVPSARVDEHLRECADCRVWFGQVSSQAHALRKLVHSRPVIASLGPIGTGPARRRWVGSMTWQRSVLLVVGVAQIALAVVQGVGLSVGLPHNHPIGSHHHLLNESTSWSLAIGVVMLGAAVWPQAAAGLAAVLMVFVAVLAVYVAVDALSGAVTVFRMLTHLPVVLGAIVATMVWRGDSGPGPTPDGAVAESEIVLPKNASRGRRRGHLRPTDGSAA